jgi:hypothetical protein
MAPAIRLRFDYTASSGKTGVILLTRTASNCRGECVLRLAKLTIVLLSIAFIGVFSQASAKDNPDSYSGKWILDKHSPRPGDAPNDLETRIKQDNSGITIESSFKEPDNGVVPLLYLGVMSNKLHLNTDGQEQQAQIGPFMAVFKSTLDGNKITTDWKAEIKGDAV